MLTLRSSKPAPIPVKQAARVQNRSHRVPGNIVSLSLAERLHHLYECEPLRLLREKRLQGLAVALTCTTAQRFERMRIHQPILFPLHHLVVPGKAQDND